MTNQIISYDTKNEAVRAMLESFISDRGVKQKWICDKISLSGCSVSLFLNNKRMLTDDHLDQIIDICTK